MKSLHQRLVNGKLSRALRIVVVAALSAMVSACAAVGSHTPPPPPPPPAVEPGFTIKADARPVVGDVLPVEIVPPQVAIRGSVKVVSARFIAVQDDGTRVPALSPEDAAARVGDADKLREAITDEGSAALVAKEVALGPGLGGALLLGSAAGGPFGVAFGFMAFPVITSYGFYNGVRLATSSQQRLDAISYSESRFSYLTANLRTKVFIYFPKGHYRRLETAFHLRADGTNLESDQTVSQDWPAASEPSDAIAQQ